MGRNKQFIKKGEGVKFFLVHRSQKDPLYLDENLGEHVLVPVDPDTNNDLVEAVNGLTSSSKSKPSSDKDAHKQKRLEEQQKFGIYYEDNYDYLQHLRDVENNEDQVEMDKLEVIKVGSVIIKTNEFGDDDNTSRTSSNDQKPKLQLPSSVFASKYEEDVGYMNQAAPDHDPKIDWDPEIVKILDEDSDVNYEDDFEDDFFVKANSESVSKHSKKEDVEDEEDEDEDEEDYDESDDDSNGRFSGSETESVKEFDSKTRFSSYSMTSSVIRRNAGLKQLDVQFEKFFAQYDDDQIGALDTEEIEGYRTTDPVLESAIEEFNKLMQKKLYVPEPRTAKSKLGVLVEQNESDGDSNAEDLDENETDEDSENENDNNKDFDVVKFCRKKDKEERFDCESIISTYSTLYNHPSIISEKSEKAIQLSKKTGLPLGVFAEKPKTLKEMDKIDHKITRLLPEVPQRSPTETKEEKKARKLAVKEHRRERRVEKKINKQAFKDEKRNQISQIKNTLDSSNIVKLPL